MKTVKNNISNGFLFLMNIVVFWPAGGRLALFGCRWPNFGEPTVLDGSFSCASVQLACHWISSRLHCLFPVRLFPTFLSEQPQYFFHVHQTILETNFLLQLVWVPYMQDKESHNNPCTPPLIGLKPSGCKLGPLYGEFGLLTDPCWGPTRSWTPLKLPNIFFWTKKGVLTTFGTPWETPNAVSSRGPNLQPLLGSESIRVRSSLTYSVCTGASSSAMVFGHIGACGTRESASWPFSSWQNSHLYWTSRAGPWSPEEELHTLQHCSLPQYPELKQQY